MLCEGGTKLMKVLLSTSIICDLIILQLQTCGILKTKYYFRILGNLKKILKIINKF